VRATKRTGTKNHRKINFETPSHGLHGQIVGDAVFDTDVPPGIGSTYSRP
jgi:hypothetical protein